MKIFIKKLRKDAVIPQYQTEGSSGMDVCALLDDIEIIKKQEIKIIPTGISIAIPSGYECQVRPRSGLAAKYGVTVLNSPGTIDSDYRGEIKIILINLGEENFAVKNGDRIAQLTFTKIEQVKMEITEVLPETARGENGFGSTGI